MKLPRMSRETRLAFAILAAGPSVAGATIARARVRTPTEPTLHPDTALAANSPSPLRRVLGLTRLMAREVVTVEVAGDSIEATPEHRFFVVGQGWVAARLLRPGQRVEASTAPGFAVVSRVQTREIEPRPIFNLLVESDHTFRVGRQGLLVHNGDCVLRPRPTAAFGRRVSLAAPPGRQLALTARATEEASKAEKSGKIAELRAKAAKVTVSAMNPADRSYIGVVRAGQGYYREGWYTSVGHMSGAGVEGYRQADVGAMYRDFVTLAERRRGQGYTSRRPSQGFKSLATIGEREPADMHYAHVTVDHRGIAGMLKANGHTNESVLLATCKAGDAECANNLAQRLANKINAPVLAPSTYLNTDGKPFKPSNDGIWRLFQPGKPNEDPRRVDTFVLKLNDRPQGGEGVAGYRQQCFIPEPGQHCRLADAPRQAIRDFYAADAALPGGATGPNRPPMYHAPTYGRYYPPDAQPVAGPGRGGPPPGRR